MAFESQVNRRMSPNTGMQMKQMVRSHLGPQSTGSDSTPNPSTLSPAESARNYKITAWLNSKNFMGTVFTRFVLPGDTDDSHAQRTAEFWRQSAMPWGNTFMVTPTDQQRLNNPAHSSFVKQRQLNVGSDYGRFYAFMHALSAAFGQLNTGQ